MAVAGLMVKVKVCLVIPPRRGNLFSCVWPLGESVVPGRLSSVTGLAPLVVLCLAVLVFFRRDLFTDWAIIPWDFRYFHLPLATALANALKSGESLLWDPSTYCGRPLFADPQVQLYYLPTDAVIALSAVLPSFHLAYLLEWQLVLHVFAAGALTYFFLRRMGYSRAAALSGGLIFELGGFFASQTQHLGAIDAAAWIPLMWTAAWELRSQWSRWWFAVLAVAGAMCLLAGFPAVAITGFVSTFLLSALFCGFRQGRWPQLAVIVLSFLTAAGLSAVLLLPAIQLTLLSVAKYRADWVEGRGLPVESLVSLVLPDHYHIFDLKLYKSPWNPTFLYLYGSVAGLILAFVSCFRKGAGRQRWPLAMATLLSGTWMFGTLTPFGKAAFLLTPKLVRGSLYPEYAMVTFCLGMACLAAMGLDSIRRLGPMAKYGIALAAAADLIVTGGGRPMNTADVRQEPGFTHNRINGSAALASELRRLTRRTDPPARMDTFQDAVTWSTTAPLTGIPTANGYNPMALERLMQVRLLFAKGQRSGAWYQVEDLDSPVLDLLGIRSIVTRQPLPTAATDSSRLVEAGVFPGTFIYENPRALPRFWLVHRVETADTMAESVERMRADFDPAQEAIVESPGLTPPPPILDLREPDGAVLVLGYHPGRIDVRVSTTRPAFLVSSEAYYPGWHASLDGKRTPVYITNAAFLGVAIPPGDQTLSFAFAPAITWTSALVSIVSVIALVVVLLPPRFISGQLHFRRGDPDAQNG
jgi:hypothetical protein